MSNTAAHTPKNDITTAAPNLESVLTSAEILITDDAFTHAAANVVTRKQPAKKIMLSEIIS